MATASQKAISIQISIPIAIDSPSPIARTIDSVPPPIPVSHSGAPGPATVPSTIARIVAIDELVELLILATSATLCGRYRRQGRQQKQAHQHQDYLAFAFHQPHKTSINPNGNLLRQRLDNNIHAVWSEQRTKGFRRIDGRETYHIVSGRARIACVFGTAFADDMRDCYSCPSIPLLK